MTLGDVFSYNLPLIDDDDGDTNFKVTATAKYKSKTALKNKLKVENGTVVIDDSSTLSTGDYVVTVKVCDEFSSCTTNNIKVIYTPPKIVTKSSDNNTSSTSRIIEI